MDCSLDSEHILRVSNKYLSNNSDTTKFLHDDANDAKAIAIPQIFFQNSHANKNYNNDNADISTIPSPNFSGCKVDSVTGSNSLVIMIKVSSPVNRAGQVITKSQILV